MAETFADLSHHNETADLAAYAAAGHTRVALKATEGTSFTDPAFVGRWREAGRVGLRRGAYHFARTVTGGAAQADRLLAAVDTAGPMGAGDWLVLDVEDNSTATATARADEFAAEFCGRMVARGHPTGLLYTGRWYANPAGIGPDDVPAGWRRLWLADYGTASDTAMSLPAGWTRGQVAARQYTNAGALPGITGPVDISRVLTDWKDDMALTDEDVQRLRLDWRADMQEILTKVLRSEGVSGAADTEKLAAALAPVLVPLLPEVADVDPKALTAALATALGQIKVTTTVEPTP